MAKKCFCRCMFMCAIVVISAQNYYFCAADVSIPGNNFLKAEKLQVAGYTEDDEGEWTEPYHFIFATDPQPGLIDQIEGFNGSKWDVEINRTEEIVTALNKLTPRPRFLFIGGDIINAFPGEEYRSQQIADIRKAFSGLNTLIPIFVIPGNHDVGNVPTNDTMALYRQDFGDEYYSFWMGGVFYIALHSQCFFNSSMTEDLCDEQDAWFKTQLERAEVGPHVHTMIFMHIPLFLLNAEEDDGYFAVPKSRRLEMLENIAMAGIKKAFSGHYHRNAGGTWNSDNNNTVQVIVSSAIGAQLGEDKSGIRIVEVSESSIKQQYYAIADIPTYLGGAFKIGPPGVTLALCFALAFLL